MPLSGWIERYERKTGEAFTIPPEFQLAFDPQHGFFAFGFSMWQGKEWLELCSTSVDSWQWVFDSVIDTVRANNLAGCLAKTNRNHKAFGKVLGAKYQGIDIDGSHVFTWEVQDVQF